MAVSVSVYGCASTYVCVNARACVFIPIFSCLLYDFINGTVNIYIHIYISVLIFPLQKIII